MIYGKQYMVWKFGRIHKQGLPFITAPHLSSGKQNSAVQSL